MKKILFDLYNAQPNGETKFHGGGEYIKRVYGYLLNSYMMKQIELHVFYDKSKFIDEWIIESFKNSMVICHHIENYASLDKLIKLIDFDIFYSGLPSKEYELKNLKKIYSIGTIHGLRKLEMPVDKYTYMYRTGMDSMKSKVLYFLYTFANFNPTEEKNRVAYRKYLDVFDKIITVSNHSKYSMCNFLNVYEDSINVLYSPLKIADMQSNEKSLIKGKYILVISCNRWEKNSYRAISAIDGIINHPLLSEYKIVTVGEIPRKIRKKIRHINRYIQYDYVETENLENLYKYCDIFLYPSLNEGFGYPPLEAMKYGKTCIVSGVCSIPEICGDAVIYCNPHDIYEIRNRILMAVQNKKDPHAVYKRFHLIKEKQENDLEKLVRNIVEGKDDSN